MAVEVFINGKRDEVDAPVTISALLESKRLKPEVVSVAHNRVMLKRDAFGDTVAGDGDVVEIMIQLAGGSDA